MMKTVLFVLLAAIVAAPAAAQSIPGCGGVQLKTDIWQGPDYQKSVFGYTQTTRNLDGCLVKLRIEAWVEGIVMKVAVGESWGTSVAKTYGAPVPTYAPRTAVGKHFAILSPLGWVRLGYSSDTTAVVKKPADEDPPEDPVLASGDPSCSGCVSPIIINAGRNGYKLTGIAEGVQFDLDGDGLPEQTSWTHQDSDDAFLVMDRNGNGRIDDGTELFGNHTPAYPGQRTLTAANGFEALGFLQSPDYGRSNGDDIIDARDEVFGRLLLWTDRNHNGVSEPDELQPAAAAGLVGIRTDYQEVGRKDRYGNVFRQMGTVLWSDGQSKCYDVWLRVR